MSTYDRFRARAGERERAHKHVDMAVPQYWSLLGCATNVEERRGRFSYLQLKYSKLGEAVGNTLLVLISWARNEQGAYSTSTVVVDSSNIRKCHFNSILLFLSFFKQRAGMSPKASTLWINSNDPPVDHHHPAKHHHVSPDARHPPMRHSRVIIAT